MGRETFGFSFHEDRICIHAEFQSERTVDVMIELLRLTKNWLPAAKQGEE